MNYRWMANTLDINLPKHFGEPCEMYTIFRYYAVIILYLYNVLWNIFLYYL